MEPIYILTLCLIVVLTISLSYSKAVYSKQKMNERVIDIYERNYLSKIETGKDFAEVQSMLDNMPWDIKKHYSDGYHTYGELYEFRKVYNAGFFMMLSRIPGNPYKVNKSLRHSDGELCFGGGWFIVAAELPSGQISNHYRVLEWDLFDIPESEIAAIPFDGHTPADVLERMEIYLKNKKP